MNLETNPNVEQNSYKQYQELGGIISETDYTSALLRAKNIKTIHKSGEMQVKIMARVAGIVLENPEDTGDIDPRVALYTVLRADTNSNPNEKYHHNQMTDQRLFAEVLRMLGDTESLEKFIKAHPHIFPPGK